jgi:hypothetical protein
MPLVDLENEDGEKKQRLDFDNNGKLWTGEGLNAVLKHYIKDDVLASRTLD